VTPAESLAVADINPTDEAVFAYLSACALACIYDGGTMALSRRWSRDPQTVASLRRAAGVQAGQTLIAQLRPLGPFSGVRAV